MKVLHIIDSGGLYGAEMMLLTLIAEQIEQGLDPTIVSIGEKGIWEKPLETEAQKRGFKIIKIRMNAGFSVQGLYQILRLAINIDANILHSHGYKGNILLGFTPKFFRKIPLITTLHGWTSTKGLSKLRIYEWLDAKSLQFIEAVVVVNKAMLTLPKIRKRKNLNLFVVNNGIKTPSSIDHASTQNKAAPTDLIPNLDPSILNFCKSGFNFCAIGRLSDEKGHIYLLEAFRFLFLKYENVKLIILGEGDQRRNLEQFISNHNLGNHVFLPGYISNAKSYLSYCDTFVISSLTEGLPITILEAMQAKTPIISTNVGGISDTLENGDSGVLVEPGNSNELEKAMKKIYLDRNLRNKLISKAYKRVTNCYSSKSMAQEYQKIYQQILTH